MTLDVVYVSYRKDLSWLCYSIQLLQKFFRSSFRTVVRVEPDCKDVIDTWGAMVTYHYVRPWPDGYAFQMYMKMMADQYTDAELIMLLDSDHMLVKPVYLEEFLADGKPIIRYQNWDADPNNTNLTVGLGQWGPPVERTLGIPLDRDYMVRPPFIFWRDTFAKVRNRVEEVTGLPFHDAVYSDQPYHYQNFLKHPKVFCDYEALGLYAAKFEPERYAVLPASTQTPFRVYWSHEHWSPQVQADLDRRLAQPLHEPFNGDRFLEAEIRSLVRKHGVTTIIETGTHFGLTSEALGTMAPVLTLEINREFWPKATRLDGSNVARLFGDSAELLPKLLPGVPEPILFYLDAHWDMHSPLLDELEAIRQSRKKPVIVIHDFHNPEHPEYGYDTWDIGPYNLSLVRPLLEEIYGPHGYSYHFNDQAQGQRRGVIFIEPLA